MIRKDFGNPAVQHPRDPALLVSRENRAAVKELRETPRPNIRAIGDFAEFQAALHDGDFERNICLNGMGLYRKNLRRVKGGSYLSEVVSPSVPLTLSL